MKNFLNIKISLTLAIFQRTLKFYDNHNEIVVGKMKDEYKEIPINKFVGLKSKMRCILSEGNKKSNTAKGVNISLEFDEYISIMLYKQITKHKMRRIQSKKHKIGTYEINKILSSCFDDKRFVLDDGVHTLAFFHKNLRNRFSQMIINKNRFSKMIMKKKRFSQTKLSAHR